METTEHHLASDGRDRTSVHVEEVVRHVREELRQLYQQRAEMTRRIGTVKRTMVGLAFLFGDKTMRRELTGVLGDGSAERKPGVTKACRRILMKADHAMSAREVHDLLQEATPSLLSAHKHPLTSVTTVLNRLAVYGEVQRVLLGNGRRAWQWIVDPQGQGERRAPL